MRFGFSLGFGVRFVEVVVVVVVRCGAGENDLVEGEVGREDLDGKIKQKVSYRMIKSKSRLVILNLFCEADLGFLIGLFCPLNCLKKPYEHKAGSAFHLLSQLTLKTLPTDPLMTPG